MAATVKGGEILTLWDLITEQEEEEGEGLEEEGGD